MHRYFLGQQQTGLDDEVVTYLNISHIRVEDGGHYKVSNVACSLYSLYEIKQGLVLHERTIS